MPSKSLILGQKVVVIAQKSLGIRSDVTINFASDISALRYELAVSHRHVKQLTEEIHDWWKATGCETTGDLSVKLKTLRKCYEQRISKLEHDLTKEREKRIAFVSKSEPYTLKEFDSRFNDTTHKPTNQNHASTFLCLSINEAYRLRATVEMLARLIKANEQLQADYDKEKEKRIAFVFKRS